MPNESFTPERISTLTLQLKDKMGVAISEIEKINLKSNLLAINAKVESTRAGQAGAAFSVVASEMANLSRSISELINKLEKDISVDFKDIAKINEHIAINFRGTRLSDIALTNIDLIDRNLYERSCDVRWWATDSSVISALTEENSTCLDDACERLNVILDSYTVYFDLVLCDREGNIVANGKKDKYNSIGKNVSESEWFLSAMDCKTGNDFAWQTVHRSPLVDDELVLVYSTAVRERGVPNGKVIGVLGIVFRYESLGQTIVENVPLTKEEKDKSRICIVDDNGLVLADSCCRNLQDKIDFKEKNEIFKNKKGFIVSNYEGSKCCIAHALSAGYETYSTGWHSLIIQKL